NIFVMNAIRMCCCLSTISFDSHKPALRCRHYLGEHQAQWVISQRSLPRWEICRSELHRQTRDRLLRSKPFTFRQMTSQTLRRQTLLRAWTQPLCLSGRSLSWEFIPPLIHWHPHQKPSPPRLSAKIITTSLETCSEYCNDTKISRTSSLF